MTAGGTDLLHLRRLTWDALESQTPPTAERLARELAVPVRSVCEWLDGESKPGDAQILAMIKLTREQEAKPQPGARSTQVAARPPSNANDDDSKPRA
jgi:hypothetical protein